MQDISSDNLYPGVKNLFADLKRQNIKIVLGSASRNARIVLDGLGMTDEFDAISDGLTHARGKPHPDVFLCGAAMVGATPSQCIVIEDAAAGIDAALRGGFIAVGMGNYESLKHAHLFVDSLEQLGADTLRELHAAYRVPSLVGPAAPVSLELPCVHEFTPTGDGSASVWTDINWQPLTLVGAGHLSYQTRFKAAYTAEGLTFLIDCEDKRLDCSYQEDETPLYNEDVVELFVQPDPDLPVYIEYEISPLDHDLLLRVVNTDGLFRGWRPWLMPEDARPRHATAVRGGEKRAGASVTGWSAEVILPWELFSGLCDIPPQTGAAWRVNVYRIDTAEKTPNHWAWGAQTGTHFHNYPWFGRVQFGISRAEL